MLLLSTCRHTGEHYAVFVTKTTVRSRRGNHWSPDSCEERMPVREGLLTPGRQSSPSVQETRGHDCSSCWKGASLSSASHVLSQCKMNVKILTKSSVDPGREEDLLSCPRPVGLLSHDVLYPNRFWAAVVPFPALHRSQNGSFWPKAPADDFELRSLRSRWVVFPARFCFGRGSVLEKLGRTHSASACHITVSNASPLLIAFA